MKRIIVDTNVLLRFLLNDVPEQTRIARQCFLDAKKGSVHLTIPLLVIIELAFVLLKLYKFSKLEVIQKIQSIAETSYLNVEQRDVILRVLAIYNTRNISIVDLLLLEMAHQSQSTLFTFDKQLARLQKQLSSSGS